MPHRALQPSTWRSPVGYANGIEAAPGRTLFLAGQIGWDAEQRIVGPHLTDQFAQALDNILAIVAEAGGRPEHVCRMTGFCTDKPAYMGARPRLGAIWRERFGRHYPAMSLVFVVDLVDEGATIELEATAVLPLR